MIEPVSTDPKIPPLHLEQVALGEREDPRARPEELEALAADNAAILEQHPPERMARLIRARADLRPAARRRAWLPALAVPLAAGVALLLMIPAGPADDTVREKGARPHLVIETQAGPLRPGDAVAPGAALMISYVAAGARYGAVLSFDGAGHRTQHLPLSGDVAVPLDGPGKVPLPRAFALDDAPGFERFELWTYPEPFSLEDPPDDLSVTAFEVTKP